MRIFLIRHGEAIKEGNDSVLTAKGNKQAENIAKILKKIKFDIVYTSTLTRSKQTLEKYKHFIPEIEVIESEDICEIYRVIVGGPVKEGTSKDRQIKDKNRADKFFNFLLNSKKEKIAVFTHGNIIRYFLSKALHMSPKKLWQNLVISPGSISIIEITKEKEIQIKAVNLYEHQKQFLNEFLDGSIITERYL